MDAAKILNTYLEFGKLADQITEDMDLTDDQKRSLHESERVLRRYLQLLYDREDSSAALVK